MLGQWAPGPGGPQPGQEGEDEAARGPPWPPHSSQRLAVARSPAPAMPPARCPGRPPPVRRPACPPPSDCPPASHRGRVLLEAAGQWGRRAESIRPMDAPLGPGGGRSQGRGGAGSDPRLLVPSSAQGLCAPLWSSRWRWRHLSSLEREVTELKSPGLREALDGPRSMSA